MYEPMVSLHSSNAQPDASTLGRPRKEHAPLRAAIKKPCGAFHHSTFHKVKEFFIGSDSRREQIVLEIEPRMRNIHQDDKKSHTKDERSIHDRQKGYPEISTPREANWSSTDKPMKPILPRTRELRPFLSKDTCTTLDLMLAAKCTPETPFRVGISTAWRNRSSFSCILLPMHSLFSQHSISNSRIPRFMPGNNGWKEISAQKNYRNLQVFTSTMLRKPTNCWQTKRNNCATSRRLEIPSK